MQDSTAKENKWGKKWMEICAIKGGGPTPDGKCHFKLDQVYCATQSA